MLQCSSKNRRKPSTKSSVKSVNFERRLKRPGTLFNWARITLRSNFEAGLSLPRALVTKLFNKPSSYKLRRKLYTI
uniref:Uncharacterized protein n=1 Tax=Romanomermis culicivorax TaxID=13658 RepID=A0A915I0U4_ROMCU